jgi:hypothetical protein
MKMTNEQLIAKVEAKHRAQIGYHFSGDKIREIILAGYDAIKDGECFAQVGKQRLYKVGNTAECRVDGNVIKAMPIDTDEKRDSLLIEYAYSNSVLGSSAGNIG